MAQFIAPRPSMAAKNKFSVPARKPRNPLVANALMRQAGSHSTGNERQRARRDTRQQLINAFSERSTP